MINLCTAYFDELMSKGNTEACHRLLAHNVEHKDMVGGCCDREQLAAGVTAWLPGCRQAGLLVLDWAAGNERATLPD